MNRKRIKYKYIAVTLIVLNALIIVNYLTWQDNSINKDIILKKDAKIKQLEEKNRLENEKVNRLERELNSLIQERDKLLLNNEDLTKEIQEIKDVIGKQERPNKENKYGLVRLKDIDPTFVEDLRYATENNFVKKQIYPECAVAILRKDVAMKLKKANEIFQKDGYTIKIWDAYRPQSAQYILWDYASDKSFVANPKKGSKHNRGAAVDITLIDESGNEIEMGTEFDNFTEKAAYNYSGHTNIALKNMKYLRNVMEQVGFKGISNEWWHFDDVDWKKYQVLDVGFDEFN